MESGSRSDKDLKNDRRSMSSGSMVSGVAIDHKSFTEKGICSEEQRWWWREERSCSVENRECQQAS